MSAKQNPHAANEPATADTLPAASDNVVSADRVSDAGAADPAPDIPALLEKAKAEAAELRDAWLRAQER